METTTTVTESDVPATTVVAPVIVTPEPEPPPIDPTIVGLIERLTRLEGQVLEMGTGLVPPTVITMLEQRVTQLETAPIEDETTETVTEIEPTPLPDAALEKPKRARGPIARLLLGQSV